ncbi:MAG: SLC13 family permease [Chloroflexota bacterium]
MTPQIATTLVILLLAVVLFVSERIRYDLVALMVLGSLAITGLVSPTEALSGFSNPAVVTVWAVFILSGGLARAGVANMLGRHILRVAGVGEARLIALIMLTAGLLSGLMNNIGVAALLLPVIMDIARRTGHPPSKLLMPLAFGSLLGGAITLIGTPPNILVSNALMENGLRPFRMFDYTPVGLAVLIGGVIFMALIGRHLLPVRDIAKDIQRPELTDLYDIRERMYLLRLPSDSTLSGKTLKESKLGSIFGLNVVVIIRDDHTRLSPGSEVVLQSGDQLLVSGRLDWLGELNHQQHLLLQDEKIVVEDLVTDEVSIVELALPPHSPLIGQTLRQLDFRRRYGGIVLTIWHEGQLYRDSFDNLPLAPEDVLLVQGPKTYIEALLHNTDFLATQTEQAHIYHLNERMMVVRVPPVSGLVGKTLAESRLSEVFGLAVLGIVRQGTTHLMPTAEDKLQADDTLLVKGNAERLQAVQKLQELEINHAERSTLTMLESDKDGLVEAVLSPHTTLVGKTLHQLNFREKYGLSVLAIWREGRARYSNLAHVALRFGDALLLYGPRDRLRMLSRDADFLMLSEAVQERPITEKAPMAGLVMVVVLLPVILGWLPIYIAAVIGAALMVLVRCLNMDEAYHYIEWKAVFLIAGMMPLGIAMEQTGAARYLAEGFVATVGGFGPLAVSAALFIITALATQVIPTPVVVVLLSPIALNAASNLGISPYPLMMTVAVSASAAFLSPVAHPANVLILGPGGYRFRDYIKVGLPLTLVTLGVFLFVLPLFWPFKP